MTHDELVALTPLLAPYRRQLERLWDNAPAARSRRPGAGAQPAPGADLLTLPQAARRLGCSRSHLYNLIAAGELRRFDISAVPTATKTRVSDADVTAYIERCGTSR